MHMLPRVFLVAAVSLWVGMGSAATQDSRCRYADSPKYCPALNWCCPYDMTHVCRGYRGYHEPYRRYGGGTFCVRPVSNEDRADLSRNCRVFVRC